MTAVTRSTGGLAIISCSMKPPPGSQNRSAVRSLSTHLVGLMKRFGVEGRLLDLRERPLPLFDGVAPEADATGMAQAWLEEVDRASALLFGVPVYWSCPAPGFVNLIDVLCGPVYDLHHASTPFAGKPAGYFAVCSDVRSARAAASVIDPILDHVGCVRPFSPVIVENPRDPNTDWEAINAELVALGGGLLKRAIANA